MEYLTTHSNRLLRGAAALTLGSLLALTLAVPALANHPGTTVFVNVKDTKDDASGCGKEKNPCNTIQGGVDHAVAGETVRILKGSYSENVIIPAGKDGLTLQGADRAKVVLKPGIPDTCEGDPTRTVFAGGPNTMACRQFDDDQTGCETAWAINRNDGGVSCFFEDDQCLGCARNNQEDESACTNTCGGGTGAGILVGSADVTIKSLSVRGGEASGIYVGPDATATRITGVNITGTPAAGVDIRAVSTQVKQSQLKTCGSGIDAAADDVLVRGNSLSQCGDCIFVEGDGARIEDNQVSIAGDCIEVEGNDAMVTGNTVTLCDGDGVSVEGNAMTVSGNVTDATDSSGIDVECDQFETTCGADLSRTFFAGGPNSMACRQFDDDQTGCETAWAMGGNGPVSCFWEPSESECRGCSDNNQNNENQCTNTCDLPCTTGLVADNVVTRVTADDCFQLDANAAGLVAEDNRGNQCTESGFDVEGTGIVLRRNEVTKVGYGRRSHGFRIRGDDHVLTNNIAKGASGDGFNVDFEASGNTLTSNTASKNAGDGFDVEPEAEDTTLDSNTAKNNIGAGIEVSTDATDTTVVENTASKNQVDFCNNGAPTSVVGNDFGTVGECRDDASNNR